MSATMLATVPQDSCVTLGDAAMMTNKELVAVAIQAFAKIRDYIPYIVELKSRFDAAERNSENRLRTPIRGCYSWKEFCTSILNRPPEIFGMHAETRKKSRKHVNSPMLTLLSTNRNIPKLEK